MIRRRKRRIFISHSEKTRYNAYELQSLLEDKHFSVISDMNHNGSFWEFMDKIAQCDLMVVILNNSFFYSPYCIYEIFKAYKCKIPIYVISLYRLDAVECETDRKNSYECMVDRIDVSVMSFKQRKEFAYIYENFHNYNELILKLLNEYTFKGGHNDFLNVVVRFFRSALNTNLSPAEISENEFMSNKELYGLSIIDEIERSEFVFFLHDLVRCSYFRMSLFEEDIEGEIEWQYIEHEIKKCELGYLMIISALDAEGNRHEIPIDRIKTIEPNLSSFSDSFLRYYFVIYKKDMIQAYIREMRKPEERRKQSVIDSFWTNGIERRRITLTYNDHDAFA